MRYESDGSPKLGVRSKRPSSVHSCECVLHWTMVVKSSERDVVEET